jgi:hypothetical protein
MVFFFKVKKLIVNDIYIEAGYPFIITCNKKAVTFCNCFYLSDPSGARTLDLLIKSQ